MTDNSLKHLFLSCTLIRLAHHTNHEIRNSVLYSCCLLVFSEIMGAIVKREESAMENTLGVGGWFELTHLERSFQ